MVLIAVSCDPSDITLLLEVSTFDQLKAEVQTSFGEFVSAGMELDVYYLYQMTPSPTKQQPQYGGQSRAEPQDVEVSVRCEQGLEAFLKATDQTPPMLLVRECEPLVLPSSLSGRRIREGDDAHYQEQDQDQEEEDYEEQGVQARKSIPSRTSGGARKAARPVSAATAGRVAAAPRDAYGYDDEEEFNNGPQLTDEQRADLLLTNQERAKALLASFRTPVGPEPQQIRVVFRDGSASKLIPFNAFNPPAQFQLMASVKNAMKGLLDNSPAASAAGANGQELLWMLAAYCPAVTSEYDLEDDRDVMHLARLVKQYGDMEVQILVDVTDSTLEHINSSPERRSRMRGATSAVLTTQPVTLKLCPSPVRDDKLQVNLVHTPGKVKNRKQELSDCDARDDILGGDDDTIVASKPALVQSGVD